LSDPNTFRPYRSQRERPVFKTWAVGLNLRPPRYGHCPECLEAGVGRFHNSKFTLSRIFSSRSQLAALELRNCHDLTM
ncbi:hypothetical protein, partial [Lactiplantibacillus pentosus]|uniref:hypothetical protein n=1 Tax=Lactiplantibacillus pentosus TaxID=1589 RepID=UPI001CDD2279